MGLTIHIDGGSRGNPGPAGAGVVIADDGGGLIHEAGYFLGKQTNNAAEYLGCIRALQRVARCEPQPIRVCSDSELLVRQITGAYRVKSPSLEQLFHQVQVLLLKVRTWHFQHIPREQNKRADQLANMAMDAADDVIVFDVERGDDPDAEPPPVVMPTAAAALKAAAPTGGSEIGAVTASRTLHVEVATSPRDGVCPAGGFDAAAYSIEARLPGGWCLHAAQTLVPTLLAMQNTEPHEFAAIPVLTLRCTRAGCGAVFRVSPRAGTNGSPRGAD